MVQGCTSPPCALMQHCLMQNYSLVGVAIEIHDGDIGVCVCAVPEVTGEEM